MTVVQRISHAPQLILDLTDLPKVDKSILTTGSTTRTGDSLSPRAFSSPSSQRTTPLSENRGLHKSPFTSTQHLEHSVTLPGMPEQSPEHSTSLAPTNTLLQQSTNVAAQKLFSELAEFNKKIEEQKQKTLLELHTIQDKKQVEEHAKNEQELAQRTTPLTWIFVALGIVIVVLAIVLVKFA